MHIVCTHSMHTVCTEALAYRDILVHTEEYMHSTYIQYIQYRLV